MFLSNTNARPPRNLDRDGQSVQVILRSIVSSGPVLLTRTSLSRHQEFQSIEPAVQGWNTRICK